MLRGYIDYLFYVTTLNGLFPVSLLTAYIFGLSVDTDESMNATNGNAACASLSEEYKKLGY